MLAQKFGDADLIGFCGGGDERHGHLAKTQLEEAVAAPRLAVIVALRRRSAEDFDLAIVQPEPAINGGDLRFESALVRQEDARRAAFDDRRRDRADRKSVV